MASAVVLRCWKKKTKQNIFAVLVFLFMCFFFFFSDFFFHFTLNTTQSRTQFEISWVNLNYSCGSSILHTCFFFFVFFFTFQLDLLLLFSVISIFLFVCFVSFVSFSLRLLRECVCCFDIVENEAKKKERKKNWEWCNL